jgi:DNA-binding NarL/FixJ family response regulator
MSERDRIRRTTELPKARIVIIDDHPVVRSGFAGLVAREPDFEVCGEADDVASALIVLRKTRPDAALVDLDLRNGNGLSLIRKVAAEKLPVRMLVVSMYDESLFAERALRAGAAGYINKQAPGRQIIDALRGILNGNLYLSESLVSRSLLPATSGGTRSNEGPVGRLSNRELEVFTMIGNGLPPAEIAEKLRVSIKTIDTYRQRIKDKLWLKNSAELSREAMHWALERLLPVPGR